LVSSTSNHVSRRTDTVETKPFTERWNNNAGITTMPLFEVETDAHIIITWADDEGTATAVAADCYPG
jgi:hypothetical protein